jgi:hypothetical protein
MWLYTALRLWLVVLWASYAERVVANNGDMGMRQSESEEYYTVLCLGSLRNIPPHQSAGMLEPLWGKKHERIEFMA